MGDNTEQRYVRINCEYCNKLITKCNKSSHLKTCKGLKKLEHENQMKLLEQGFKDEIQSLKETVKRKEEAIEHLKSIIINVYTPRPIDTQKLAEVLDR